MVPLGLPGGTWTPPPQLAESSGSLAPMALCRFAEAARGQDQGRRAGEGGIASFLFLFVWLGGERTRFPCLIFLFVFLFGGGKGHGGGGGGGGNGEC